MTDNSSSFWKEFDETGEAGVREKLAGAIYGRARERSAREWLEHKIQERSDRANCEQRRYARHAKNAAIVAAVAAVIAAICAIITLFLPL